MESEHGDESDVAGARTDEPNGTGFERGELGEVEGHVERSVLERAEFDYRSILGGEEGVFFVREKEEGGLRYGWTTGACATAASVGAFFAMMGEKKEGVEVELGGGRVVFFALEESSSLGSREGYASVEKDAGDDPDVTHGAIIGVRLRLLTRGGPLNLRFCRGEGVGLVTKKGLPLPVGEAAINPKPREMIFRNLSRVVGLYGYEGEMEVEVSVKGGEALALRTWNPRLGIEGGLSILGTTGVVKPYSCSAWIHSIWRGIDVAREAGHEMIGGATGSVSEARAMKEWNLPLEAMIDMGDFVGGLLKYVRKVGLFRVGIAGGLGKMTKLAQGALDLHNKRSRVDFEELSSWGVMDDGLSEEDALWVAQDAVTVFEVGERLGYERVGGWIAPRAKVVVEKHLPKGSRVSILVVSREGKVLSSLE